MDRQAIVYFCSALARAGVDVELVTLGIRLRSDERANAENPLTLYGIDTPFRVTTIQTGLHQESQEARHGFSRLVAYSKYARRRARAQPGGAPLVFYTKNFAPTLVLLALRTTREFTVVLEAHTTPSSPLHRFVMRHVDGVVANSYALARVLEERGCAKSVLRTHQGVDLARYTTSETKESIRLRLGLPAGELIAVYTGKIYRGYVEVEHIVQAAGQPECRDVHFILVGGRDDHVAAWRREVAARGLQNVVFRGFVPPVDVHEYQLAADVLLLYYPSGMELNAYRSPGKLFGYMASGVPIVAVDLPVLREVLGEPPAAKLVPPDSPVALSRAVKDVLTQRESALIAAARARRRVTEFSWERRADRVLQFIESLRPEGESAASEPLEREGGGA